MKSKDTTPQQRLLVFSMLFGEAQQEREPLLASAPVKALRPTSVRKALEQAGVVRVVKEGLAPGRVVVGDEAWEFAMQNLGKELPQSARAARVLENVLRKVHDLLQTQSFSFAEFVNGAIRETPESAPGPVSEHDMQAVRRACLELGHGERARVRLKDLRDSVSLTREHLESTLLAMQKAGRLVLFKMDNPAEITREDEQAALFIAGQPRHLVYLEA